MQTIRGWYEQGAVRLPAGTEDLPAGPVLVTFLDAEMEHPAVLRSSIEGQCNPLDSAIIHRESLEFREMRKRSSDDESPSD